MKQLKTALILTLIGLACGLVIGLSNSITAPIIAENKRVAELQAYADLFPGLDSAEAVTVTMQGSIYEVLEVKVNGSVAGYLYKGKSNNSYGYIDLLVAITTDDVLVGVKFLDSTQTASIRPIIEGNSANLANLDVTTMDLTELVKFGANAYDTLTGGSFGSQTMRTIVRDAILTHTGSAPVVVDYIAMIYPTYDSTKLAVDNTFTGTALITLPDNITKVQVVNRQIVKDASDTVLGYLYTLYGENEVGAEEYFHAADLTVLAGVSSDGLTLIGLALPEDTYNQTPSYLSFVTTYIEQFNNVSLQTVSTLPDAITGSTQTPNLIHALLVKLAEVLA